MQKSIAFNPCLSTEGNKSLAYMWLPNKFCHSTLGMVAGAQAVGAFGAFSIPKIFKTLHSNFDICRNFQRIKMKFHILIIFNKSY